MRNDWCWEQPNWWRSRLSHLNLRTILTRCVFTRKCFLFAWNSLSTNRKLAALISYQFTQPSRLKTQLFLISRHWSQWFEFENCAFFVWSSGWKSFSVCGVCACDYFEWSIAENHRVMSRGWIQSSKAIKIGGRSDRSPRPGSDVLLNIDRESKKINKFTKLDNHWSITLWILAVSLCGLVACPESKPDAVQQSVNRWRLPHCNLDCQASDGTHTGQHTG